MDYSILRAELTDPAYADMDDITIANALNAPTVDQVGAISPESFLTWCGQHGAILKLDAAARQTQSLPLASVASAALAMINGGGMALQLGDARIAAMIDAFVQSGTFTTDDRDALYALGTSLISRADELGIGVVLLSDIVEVRRLWQ